MYKYRVIPPEASQVRPRNKVMGRSWSSELRHCKGNGSKAEGHEERYEPFPRVVS